MRKLTLFALIASAAVIGESPARADDMKCMDLSGMHGNAKATASPPTKPLRIP